MDRAENLLNQKFGRLTVIARAENHVQPSGKSYTQWLCRCECGNEVVVRSANLKKGHTKSCGCWQRDKVTTHGLKKTRLYVIWRDIKLRCFNPNANNFKDYGAKGVTMCDEWKNNFKNFYDWAMSNGYNKDAKRGECTIDRIDNSKGYCPQNCRWIDNLAQQNNRINNRFLTYNGKKQTVAEWGRELNMPRHALCARLYSGWSIEKTLTTPLGKRNR